MAANIELMTDNCTSTEKALIEQIINLGMAGRFCTSGDLMVAVYFSGCECSEAIIKRKPSILSWASAQLCALDTKAVKFL
jgi:hypothetical protein